MEADLPDVHDVVRSPAEDEAEHQDPGDLDSVDFGPPDHTAVIYLPGIDSRQDLGPPVDDDDDGGVAEDHDEERQEPGETEDKHEVEELLESYVRIMF